MSEYQYYEFRTVRKPLSREEQTEVNKWSSRGEVTPTSAKFVYHYSNFRHDPETCLLFGFDMMLYIANWGHRRLMFRFPEKEIDYKRLKDYRWDRDTEVSIQIYKKNAYVVIDIDESLEDWDDGWVEGEGVLPALTPLWTDIHKGNFACLYLIWLHFETNYQKSMMDENDEEGAEDVFEPPVPAGMNKSAASLAEFMEFWNISEDLFTVAAEASPEVKTISKTNVEKQIKELSEQDKTSYLTRFLLEEPSSVQMSLQKHLQKQSKDKIDTPQLTRRNLQEILELQKEQATRRIAETKRKAAEKRQRELQALEKRHPEAWNTVMMHLSKRTRSGYDQAVNDIKDLRDLAIYLGDNNMFNKKMAEILEEFGKSKALLDRLKYAHLIK